MPTASKIMLLVKKKKHIVFALLLFVCVLVLSQCISGPESAKADVRGNDYAGSATCKKCHQAIYNDFVQTAHANSTSAALPDVVKQGVKQGNDVFDFNDRLKVVIEKHQDKFFQTAYENGSKIVSHPFDITVGSGRKGQSFLYFDNARIFQLPLSYFNAEHTWANSPGFPSEVAVFNRSIPSICLGCHSSFIPVKRTYQDYTFTEYYDRRRIVHGIDCERCHGPAAQHVSYFTEHPNEKAAKFISSIKTLSRSQKTDMCSLCHSGVRDAQRSLFDFKPGDTLLNFYLPAFEMPAPGEVDVHGKQSVLMKASKCYLASTALTCSSCHNVHVKERDNTAVFSQRCVSCHQNVEHSFDTVNENMASFTNTNCIDCHMPLKASSAISLLVKQKTVAKSYYLRTHLIKVYPEESKRFIDSVKRVAETN